MGWVGGINYGQFRIRTHRLHPFESLARIGAYVVHSAFAKTSRRRALVGRNELVINSSFIEGVIIISKKFLNNIHNNNNKGGTCSR